LFNKQTKKRTSIDSAAGIECRKLGQDDDDVIAKKSLKQPKSSQLCTTFSGRLRRPFKMRQVAVVPASLKVRVATLNKKFGSA
jgi:hypothetical protein